MPNSRRAFFRRAVGASGESRESGGSGESHIASFVAHVRPERLEDFVRAVEARAGLEVSWQSPAGKVVVVADSSDAGEMARAIEFLGELPGAVSVGMAAHYVDDGGLKDGGGSRNDEN